MKAYEFIEIIDGEMNTYILIIARTEHEAIKLQPPRIKCFLAAFCKSANSLIIKYFD